MTLDRVFSDLAAAQAELDDWVQAYSEHRPHQAIGMDTPAQRFMTGTGATVTALRSMPGIRPAPTRADGVWVARRASALGVVCVNWQQVCVGRAAAGHNIDIWVTDEVLQFFDGDHLLKTEQRVGHGDIRKKKASIPGGQRRT